MPDIEFDICCIYIPSSGLTIFEKPNGMQVGNLTLGVADSNNEVYDVFMLIGGKKENLEWTNFHMVGYEVMALTFEESRSNYVKLKNGYWISISELESKNLRLISWMKYIVEKDTEWYANDPGLNLREEPSTDSKVIVTLEGDLWGINPTNEIKGNWCKVNVTQYRKHPCSGENNLVLQTLTGWVKLISDEQIPNVWEYGKGC